MKRQAVLGCIFILVPSLLIAQTGIFLREDFNNLDNWLPQHFPNIERHTRYLIVTEGSERHLRAESHASASGLLLEKKFDVYEYPRLRWRWKVDNVYLTGDARTKAGDDYPMRIYIIFEHDPAETGAIESLRRRITGLATGADLPHSSLEYVWANKNESEKTLTSPYTERVRIILIEKGTAKLGRWLEEEVDIVRDYERAFHRRPPATARLAIMNDSDDTGESSTSSIDWIEISE